MNVGQHCVILELNIPSYRIEQAKKGRGWYQHVYPIMLSMVIDERVYFRIDEGNYGVIFAVENKAMKLFKRGPEFKPRQIEQGRRLTCEAQCLAYERSLIDPDLARNVPAFYGRIEVEDVINADGKSIRSDYLLDCCYLIDRIDGQRHKWVSPQARGKYPYLWDFQHKMTDLGIDLLDSDVFNPEDASGFKVIDFELKDYVMGRL